MVDHHERIARRWDRADQDGFEPARAGTVCRDTEVFARVVLRLRRVEAEERCSCRKRHPHDHRQTLPLYFHWLSLAIASSGSGVDLRVAMSMQTIVASPVAQQTPSRKIACATLNELRPNSA